MAEIEISASGEREFEVEIHDEGRRTTHHVTVPRGFADAPELRDVDPEALVRESFRYLLEREPASSILSRFELGDIATYFPDYPGEIARRVRS
jgi:hypothetical protein